MQEQDRPGLGVVIIGRNEGERLRRCLASIRGASRLVYVDSGSTDGSVELAHGFGADVVELDRAVPFTAALARNAGWRRLAQIEPGLRFVHFFDGDCEVLPDWLAHAGTVLESRPDVAVVCGRRRERFPAATVFNLLCDMEWNGPVGSIKSCGGDALMRMDVLAAVGGYDAALIAGEEPELCVRIRARGWKVWREPRDMVLHDAAITRWSQWWKRSMRGGHAFAQGAFLHGANPERHYVAETRRALLWGAAMPVVIVAASVGTPFATALALVYPLQVVRLALRPSSAAREASATWTRAFFLVAARFPEAVGVLTFHWRRLRGRASTLIEYK
jgi:GT2 family glycosyltransferase